MPNCGRVGTPSCVTHHATVPLMKSGFELFQKCRVPVSQRTRLKECSREQHVHPRAGGTFPGRACCGAMSPIPTPSEELVRQFRAALEPELAAFEAPQWAYCTDHTLRRYLIARRSNVDKVRNSSLSLAHLLCPQAKRKVSRCMRVRYRLRESDFVPCSVSQNAFGDSQVAQGYGRREHLCGVH